MIYKIPIYVEVEVEGDFRPTDLNEAIDSYVSKYVIDNVFKTGGFPLDSRTDVFDETARKVSKAAKVKWARISLIPKSRVLQKIVEK